MTNIYTFYNLFCLSFLRWKTEHYDRIFIVQRLAVPYITEWKRAFSTLNHEHKIPIRTPVSKVEKINEESVWKWPIIINISIFLTFHINFTWQNSVLNYQSGRRPKNRKRRTEDGMNILKEQQTNMTDATVQERYLSISLWLWKEQAEVADKSIVSN